MHTKYLKYYISQFVNKEKIRLIPWGTNPRIFKKGGEGIVLKNFKPYSQNESYNWLKKKPFETLDLEIISKKLRKDEKGWIYGLSDNKSKVGSTWTPDNFEVGQIVEVKYEKRYEKNDKSYTLRFPKIVRLREDKSNAWHKR